MKPIKVRNGIPFYYDKSDEEFRKDVYEQFDTTVLKNARRYLSGNEPSMSSAYLLKWIDLIGNSAVIVENGCGIAYHSSIISREKPNCLIFGFDYSYQMLSMAIDLWIKKKPSTLNLLESFFTRHGLNLDRDVLFHKPSIELALAKCEDLPLVDSMIDLSFSCYLWDRIAAQAEYVQEQQRILKPGGYFIILGPMSFTDKKSWDLWYPLTKLVDFVETFGFRLVEQSSWEEKDVFDGRDNHISWQVEAFCFVKSD